MEFNLFTFRLLIFGIIFLIKFIRNYILNPTLKNFYRAEYEADPEITLQSLALKYGFEVEDLGDTSSWAKSLPLVVPTEIVAAPTKPSKEPEESDELRNNILEFKRNVVKESLTRLKMAGTMETKELKELATVVDIVDKSLRSTADSNNINVLIQNIINKYGDDV